MDHSAHECSPLNVNTYRNNNFSVLVKQTKNVARRHDESEHVIVHRSVVNLKLLTVQIRWIFHIPRDPSGAAPPRALESDWTTRGQRLLARGQSLSRPGCLFRVDPPELATVCPVDEADLPTHEEPQPVFKKRKENTCGCSGQRTVQSRQSVPFKRPALRVLTDTRRRRRSSSMDPLVAAIDQGTSSTRFLVSDVVGLMNCLGSHRLVRNLFRHFCYLTLS